MSKNSAKNFSRPEVSAAPGRQLQQAARQEWTLYQTLLRHLRAEGRFLQEENLAALQSSRLMQQEVQRAIEQVGETLNVLCLHGDAQPRQQVLDERRKKLQGLAALIRDEIAHNLCLSESIKAQCTSQISALGKTRHLARQILPKFYQHLPTESLDMRR